MFLFRNKMKIYIYIFILLFKFVWFSLACDIFISSKCPTPPAINEINANWTAFCENTKTHVDCINKKLKQCKKVQEYGPALETMKANINVIIKAVSKFVASLSFLTFLN